MFRNRFVVRLIRNLSSFSKTQPIDPLQEAALSEKCILVDEDDRRIGAASKLDCHRVKADGSLILHRAFSVFLFNSLGDILLQTRAPSKITFPSHVTNTCCSHPLEDFEEEKIENDGYGVKVAARRRLHYELGIPPSEIALNDFQYLTRIIYQQTDDGIWGEYEIDYILFLQKDVTLASNANEVSDIAYVKKSEFQSYLSTLHNPLTPWFRLIVNNRLQTWWDNLHQLHLFKDHKSIQRF